MRELEIVRLLDANGNLLASPRGRQEDVLPLSEEGLATLQDQKEWWDENTVLDENMLDLQPPHCERWRDSSHPAGGPLFDRTQPHLEISGHNPGWSRFANPPDRFWRGMGHVGLDLATHQSYHPDSQGHW